MRGSIRDDKLRMACARALGLNAFDEEAFLDQVDHVDVPEQYKIEIHMRDGRTIPEDCTPTGHRDCWTQEYRDKVSAQRRKNGTNPKGASCFTSKIKCADCGGNFRKALQKCADGKVHYWRCGDKNGCTVKGLRDDWLREMCADVLGLEAFDESVFKERIDRIDVHGGTELHFIFSDGREDVREWTFKRKSHPCSEEKKEHMREVMKQKWTPERREAMSKAMKELRREKYWNSREKSKQSQPR